MHRTINWILMLATLASIFALYAIKDGTRRLEARVQAQERALERAENDVSVLTAERAHLARPERLEPLARKLGMSPVSSGQYLRVDARRFTAARPRDGPNSGLPSQGRAGRRRPRRGEGRWQPSSSGARPASGFACDPSLPSAAGGARWPRSVACCSPSRPSPASSSGCR